MIRHALTLPCLAVALATSALAGPRASADDVPPSEVISLARCPVEYRHAALLGAGQPGVLQDRLVEVGDRVEAGQVLGHLRDGDARAELEHRLAIAESDVDIRASEAKYAQAVGKLRAAEPLRERSYVSREQYGLLELEMETAALDLEAARHRRRLAEIQARQTEELLKDRRFVSPFRGVVVEVLKAPGESVGLNDPVFRVVDPDRLQVTGQLDVADAWRVKPGQRASFLPEIGGAELPIEDRTFPARVQFVDTAIDPASLTCRVVVAVENPDGLLRAGLEGRLEIEPESGPAASGRPGPLAPADPTPGAPAPHPPADAVGRRPEAARPPAGSGS